MPIPSAAEMNPSDAGLAIFGKVAVGVLLALLIGGAISMGILVMPGSFSDIARGTGIGAVTGTLIAVVVAPSTGFIAALTRHWMRGSLRRALLAGAGMWLVWVVIAALALAIGLRFPLHLWGNIWPFLPAMAVALAAALLLAYRIYSTEDPMTPTEIREGERRHRAASRASLRGVRGRKK